MKLGLILLLGALISFALAVQKGDEFFTQRIRAKFDEDTIVWTTNAEARLRAWELGRKGVGYIDVTNMTTTQTIPQRQTKFPKGPSYQNLIDPVLQEMTAANLLTYCTKISSYPTRYYTSKTGVEAAHWIKAQFETFAAGKADVSVELFAHKWAQPSVIATIKGNGPLADEIVIIGAHEDSISFGGSAPGADDDGSGTSNVLEIFRVLVNSGIKFNRTIQFMTYSAEEVGLRGSTAIADTYYKADAKVFAVFQADMTAYVAPGKPQLINIIGDYVNSDLVTFLQSLVPVYTKLPYVMSNCDYACSDHASWYEYGFADVAVIEADPAGDIDPYIHSGQDTVDKLDFVYSLEYAKLGLSFVVELALYDADSDSSSM